MTTPPRAEIDTAAPVDFARPAASSGCRPDEGMVRAMQDAQLTWVVWRMNNLTDAERREADESVGRIYARLRRRLRRGRLSGR